MTRFTFRLPDIGEGIAEAEIVAWHVAVGDTVAEDGRLADMMTDKATVEMESPVAGTVVEVAGEVGDTVAIGSALVVIEVEGAADAVEERIEAENPDAGDADRALAAEASATGEASRSSPPDAPHTRPDRPERVEGLSFLSTQAHGAKNNEGASTRSAWAGSGRSSLENREKSPTEPAGTASAAKVLASPAVRARARDLGVNLADVRPSEDGRVRHADLDAFLAYSPGFASAGRRHADEQVRVIGLRRRIADAMSASKRAIPHFSYVEECDVTALEEARAQLNAHPAEGRPRLTLLPLLITAICRALPDFPMINARYDDESGVVTRHGAVHLGIATQTPAGLMVPVIRDAQDRNLWQLASEIARLAAAARDGGATSADLSGSTLTVTSLGALGGIATTPVINRPEVAIIGPNRIVERPMFVSDGLGGERLAKRKLMNLSISCDHRVVDGWDAASFVQAVRGLLETPALLLVR